MVVEAGDHHITILDGDKLEPIHRFPSRFALHGGPKFTPDGRYVFFASRDGWISKFDIYNLKTLVAEIRAGINTRNLAVSGDGQWVMAANYLPQTLVLLNAADLSLDRIIPVVNEAGKSSRVSAVYDAAPRKSFVAALKDIPEVWELSYDPKAEPVFKGYVHDYKMGEAIALPGMWTPRVTQLDATLDDFFFIPGLRLRAGRGATRRWRQSDRSQRPGGESRRAAQSGRSAAARHAASRFRDFLVNIRTVRSWPRPISRKAWSA